MPVKKKKYEEVAASLIDRIRSGEFQPGDRIPAERVLATEYSVSRSVIREAVRSMEQIGCVESRVGGGSFVKTPEISNIADPLAIIFEQDRVFAEELIETRLILETQVARLAAERRTDAQISAMRKSLEAMKKGLLSGEKCEKQDATFHELLAQASGNRALSMVVSTYSEVVNRSLSITQHIDGVPPMTLDDHEKILDAVIRKDGNDAERFMRRHLMNAQENLKQARK